MKTSKVAREMVKSAKAYVSRIDELSAKCENADVVGMLSEAKCSVCVDISAFEAVRKFAKLVESVDDDCGGNDDAD